MPVDPFYTDGDVLEKLHQQELAIWQQLQAARGDAREVNRSLQQKGVFSQYRQIHARYVRLGRFHRHRPIRNEALKRALFLSWYAEVEPAPFSGLADLDEDLITDAYARLNTHVEKGWISPELEWMLRHYARWEWVLLQYTENKLMPLSAWIKTVASETEALPRGSLPPGSMEGRGLMGIYYAQLGVARTV